MIVVHGALEHLRDLEARRVRIIACDTKSNVRRTRRLDAYILVVLAIMRS